MQRINGVIFYFHLLVQIHPVFSLFSISYIGKKNQLEDNVAESPSVFERARLLRFITLEQPRHLALLCVVFFLIVNEPLNLSALSPTCTSTSANRLTVNLLDKRIEILMQQETRTHAGHTL